MNIEIKRTVGIILGGIFSTNGTGLISILKKATQGYKGDFESRITTTHTVLSQILILLKTLFNVVEKILL